MAKWANDLMMDAALDYVATGTTILICTSQPADRAAALAAALADAPMSGGNYAKANGDVSGRKLTVTAPAAFSVDTSGTATHVAIITGSALLYVTTCTSQDLTAGNTVTVPAWDIEVADPV